MGRLFFRDTGKAIVHLWIYYYLEIIRNRSVRLKEQAGIFSCLTVSG